MPPSIETISSLFSRARFAEALKALNESSQQPSSSEFQTLRAELLERTGQYAEAKTIAERLLSHRSISLDLQARCEMVLGLCAWSTGQNEPALAHLQRSTLKAQSAGDHLRACWSQLRQMVLLTGQVGFDGAGPIISTVRASVTRLGDPVTSAALHIFIGELETKRGLVSSGRKHVNLGLRLLRSKGSNLWLESVAENNLAAISIMQSDFIGGLTHAETALRLASESGAANMRGAALTNLGNLHKLAGDLYRATEYFKRGLEAAGNNSELANGALESLARVALSQDDSQKAHAYLSQIESSIASRTDASLYANRHSQLTLADVLIWENKFERALVVLQYCDELATEARDGVLQAIVSTKLFKLHQRTGDRADSYLALAKFAERSSSTPLHVFADMEVAVGEALARSGDDPSAYAHFMRARRVYAGLHNRVGLLEVDRSQGPDRVAAPPRAVASAVVQGLATALNLTAHPEILATELIAVLQHAGCAQSAVAIAKDERGAETVLASFGPATPGERHARALTVGTDRQRTIELRLTPHDDIESHATANSLALLIATATELERARLEREERLTLWPIEPLPPGNEDSVVLGEMERLMIQARRIAQTNAVVLITGESGTGKEVLARAVHGYSPRARRPFVPFNCTAVARELVESQLFGHRRGAFTGADRDMLGLVRSAKDGTLFLDEVGEMALDLQPKLLRFLESGEINPLGESAPFTVDVRIVAATNADLETLVEQGRFREDLYYRLNVVRLTIPPLRERRDEIPALVHHFTAKACAEFGKQRVRVAEEAMEEMILFSWPGNVRQLQNELRRMVALAENNAVLDPTTLSKAIRQEAQLAGKGPAGHGDFCITLTDKLEPTISRIEREMIKAALTANHGKLEATARALGISRKGLYLKRQRLGV